MEAFDPILAQRFLVVGDSRSIPSNSWPDTLTTAITAAVSPNTWANNNVAQGAQGAAYFSTNIATILAGQPDNHTTVLINLGVNDFGVLTDPTWTADMLTTIDAIHSKWIGAQVYLMRTWKRGFDSDANTYATSIANIVAARPSFVHLGPDEAVWLKGSDNGATNTTDGIHYSAAGEAACVTAWRAVLGL